MACHWGDTDFLFAVLLSKGVGALGMYWALLASKADASDRRNPETLAFKHANEPMGPWGLPISGQHASQ